MHHRKQWFTKYCRWINMRSLKQAIHCIALGDMWAIHPACISWAREWFCHFKMILPLTEQSPNQSIPSKGWWWRLKKETSRKFKKTISVSKTWVLNHYSHCSLCVALCSKVCYSKNGRLDFLTKMSITESILWDLLGIHTIGSFYVAVTVKCYPIIKRLLFVSKTMKP